MRGLHRAYPLVLLVLLLTSGCDHDEKCCECLEARGEADSYTYPIQPGSPEWANLKTGEEMYQACQIPSATLEKMCTHGLIESWLTYPLLLNVFAWVTPQRGIDEMRQNFNGLNELLNNRSDGGTKLLSRYQSLDPSGYDAQWSSAEKGRYVITITAFELTVAQKSILDKLSALERIALLEEAVKKRIIKEGDSLYEPLANPSDVYIMARVMIHDDFEKFMQVIEQDFEIKHFSETGEYIYSAGNPDPGEDLTRIIEIAKSYVAQ